LSTPGQGPPQPTFVEALETDRDGLDLHLGHAAGTEELPDLFPFRVAVHHPRVDLQKPVLGVTNVDERRELPVLVAPPQRPQTLTAPSSSSSTR
jgi:hypothetical protein